VNVTDDKNYKKSTQFNFNKPSVLSYTPPQSHFYELNVNDRYTKKRGVA
jgi:hypothetical protein